MEGVRVILKSGETWLPLCDEIAFVVPRTVSLQQLKEAVSSHLGGSSAEDMVLAGAVGEALVEITAAQLPFVSEFEVYIFSSKAWRAFQVVENAQASSTEKRRAAVESRFGNDWAFFKLIQRVKMLSLSEAQVQAARDLLRRRAAVYELCENPDIDTNGDCQFDAAADQLVRVAVIPATKDSVRSNVVHWLKENADHDIGNGTTVKQWVEAMPEHSSFNEYLRKMNVSGCWGDEVTLLAIIEYFRVSIVLLTSTTGEYGWYRIHEPREGAKDNLPQLWLGHEMERHYWSLVEKGVGGKIRERAGEGECALCFHSLLFFLF